MKREMGGGLSLSKNACKSICVSSTFTPPRICMFRLCYKPLLSLSKGSARFRITRTARRVYSESPKKPSARKTLKELSESLAEVPTSTFQAISKNVSEAIDVSPIFCAYILYLL